MIALKKNLLLDLAQALDKIAPGFGSLAVFESPKLASHGDFACTAAMQMAKSLGMKPRDVAERLKALLLNMPAFHRWVESVEVAGPGFVNVRLKPAAKQRVVREVLATGDHFGKWPAHGDKVIVEFVSANPTGPLHVGHGRQAAIGDALCNLLESQGWEVHREFYYNDAGVQIETLTKSTQLRAQGFKPGDSCWPTDPANPASQAFYNGEYVQDIANDFLAKKTVVVEGGCPVIASGNERDEGSIREFAVAYLRNEQNKDLESFKLKFDVHYLESSLYATGRVDRAVDLIVDNGGAYKEDGALWFKSTDYGDDKDRVMQKKDGTFTYFVPDVAYHMAKWDRGFEKAINVQGVDHHGTIARVRAGLQAVDVGIAPGYPEYVLHTMVRVVKDGKEVKVGKRAGGYVTLRDLIEWTSVDAVRFLFLSRTPDTEYTFDVDLAVSQNNDNPVFYVQYAHARICSVLAAWCDKEGGNVQDLVDVDLTALQGPQAQALMGLLEKYPDMLAAAAQNNSPHDVTFYLRELAASYHSCYNADHVLVSDEGVKKARLALIAAAGQVLRNGLAILGVSAPERMEKTIAAPVDCEKIHG